MQPSCTDLEVKRSKNELRLLGVGLDTGSFPGKNLIFLILQCDEFWKSSYFSGHPLEKRMNLWFFHGGEGR